MKVIYLCEFFFELLYLKCKISSTLILSCVGGGAQVVKEERTNEMNEENKRSKKREEVMVWSLRAGLSPHSSVMAPRACPDVDFLLLCVLTDFHMV